MERLEDRAELAETIAAAEERGWKVARVRLDLARSKGGLFEAWNAVLPFPSWFGWNWDAFADCAFESADGPLLVILDGWRAFEDADPAAWTTLSSIVLELAPIARARVLLAE
ncbi:MAG: barstar family protein [Thermomicrobiales bacterium]